jgi:hypothetical protein
MNKCKECGSNAAGGVNLATAPNAKPGAPDHWVCPECVNFHRRVGPAVDEAISGGATYRCDWPRCEAKTSQPFKDGWSLNESEGIKFLPDDCWLCPKHGEMLDAIYESPSLLEPSETIN